ncbi:unnamed protein product, partial [Parascedosporium putredinis]
MAILNTLKTAIGAAAPKTVEATVVPSDPAGPQSPSATEKAVPAARDDAIRPADDDGPIDIELEKEAAPAHNAQLG